MNGNEISTYEESIIIIINLNWPNNYLKAIQNTINEYDLVLVPSSEDIRNLLEEKFIKFLFILASSDCRDILKQRYIDRNNNNDMIEDVMYNYDHWSRN